MKFVIEAQSGEARRGKLSVRGKLIKTPVFMPVGTVGSVKALCAEDLEGCGAQVVLGNTYHLHQRPGEQVVKSLGGLNEMMNWKGATLTDSGGFQVFSLGDQVKILEDGVKFKSHLTGESEYWRPKDSIKIQQQIRADIIMAFDECTPEAKRTYVRAAMDRTHRWLSESISQWRSEDTGQEMFGIIQGGGFRDLREESAERITESGVSGVAIGGVSIGYEMEQTVEQIGWVKGKVDRALPFYAMGVGKNPEDIIKVIKAGADMFDCVAPTRLARHGSVYCGELTGSKLDQLRFESEFPHGRMNLRQEQWKSDKRPIKENCGCFTCRNGYSRGYLRHLLVAGELLYYRLASIHNIYVMLKLAADVGVKI